MYRDIKILPADSVHNFTHIGNMENIPIYYSDLDDEEIEAMYAARMSNRNQSLTSYKNSYKNTTNPISSTSINANNLLIYWESKKKPITVSKRETLIDKFI